MVTDDAERTMNTFLGASLDLTSNEIDELALIESEWLYLEGYLVTDDARTDVDQLGMSYQDLEKAMINKNDLNYERYLEIRKRNLHKMNPIPVCKFND